MRRRILTLCLLLAGGLFLGKGAYIFLKAQLAQVLLQQAWDRTIAGEERARPWSWADTWPVARLSAPAHDVDQIVLAGANGRTMAFGPGHLFGSSLPGDRGNTILAAHRDTHFAFLNDVRIGDTLVLYSVDGRARTYRVTGTEVVHMDQTEVLSEPTNGYALTLITCYPFNAVLPGGSLRFVVHATATGDADRDPKPCKRSAQRAERT